MGTWTLIILALGLAMDATAVSISNGICYGGAGKKQMVTYGFLFGFFQMAMPVIGYFAGKTFSHQISSLDHWVALILLGFLGGKMVVEAIKEIRCPEAAHCERELTMKVMLVQAVATSIDALAVGVSFAALDVNIAAAASFIACVTFVCCLAGHLLGKKFGSWLGGKAEIFGGVILVCIGAKILVEHLSGG